VRRPRICLLAVALFAAAATALTGCSAGFDATPIKRYAPADGVDADSGPIRVLNALVVAAPTGDAGVISMVVVNRGATPDELVSVQSDAGTVEYTGPRTLARGQAVVFGAGSNPSAVIRGLTRRPGQGVTLRLTFAKASPLTVETLVFAPEGIYATITPPAEPTPSASTTSTPSGSGPATPSESTSSAPISSPSPTSS
jgi:copper(I)-binding protein